MSTELGVYERAEEAADFLRERIGEPPGIAVILGSGLGSLAELLTGRKIVIPYAEIPHLPEPTVAGHAGNVVVGTLGDARVLIFQGRFHYYEGYDLDEVTFPIRILQRLGVHTVVLTAAVGGIAENLRAGNLVCISDHINLLGENPLRGPNDDRIGKRFPDMTEIYSHRLAHLANDEARRLEIPLKHGVYACMAGPSYETPAEIRALRTLGADVVGMSTVPEAIVARHSRMDVLAFALVTNAAAGVTGEPINHEEVLEVGQRAADWLGRLIARVVDRIREEAEDETNAEMPDF